MASKPAQPREDGTYPPTESDRLDVVPQLWQDIRDLRKEIKDLEKDTFSVRRTKFILTLIGVLAAIIAVILNLGLMPALNGAASRLEEQHEVRAKESPTADGEGRVRGGTVLSQGQKDK